MNSEEMKNKTQHEGQDEKQGTGDGESRGAALKALVIDDEITIQRLCQMALRMVSIEVITAKDGESGLQMLEEQGDTIGLVILDLTMPGLSGKETYSRIRKNFPDKKVIIVSGYSSDETLEKFGDSKPDKFFHKPFDVRTMQKEVKQLLDQ